MKARLMIREGVSELNGTHRDRIYKNGLSHGFKVLAIDDQKRTRTLIDLRIGYSTSGSTCYACLWIYGEYPSNASAEAGGYGYHKASQATAKAITKAGWMLNEPIGGRGNDAIREALLAIGKELTDDTLTLIEMHP